MGEVHIGIVEACNGLSMMVLFFALAVAVAIVIRRSWIERFIVVASAIPVAVVSNIVRITVTGVLHKTAGSDLADRVFHDLAGWLMMPLALTLLWAELRVLSWVLVPAGPRARDAEEQVNSLRAIVRSGGGGRARSSDPTTSNQRKAEASRR
jgi:exosortase/archaeosortase family protein